MFKLLYSYKNNAIKVLILVKVLRIM